MPDMLGKSSHHKKNWSLQPLLSRKKNISPLSLSSFKNILHSGLCFESNTLQGHLVPLREVWWVQDRQTLFLVHSKPCPQQDSIQGSHPQKKKSLRHWRKGGLWRMFLKEDRETQFLAALSSSRSLVVGPSVRPSVRRSVGGVCEKVTFRDQKEWVSEWV